MTTTAPARKANSSRAEISRAEPRASILLAEDDEDDVILTREALKECRRWDMVDRVPDGAELLDYLRRSGRYRDLAGTPLPRLVLLDLNMPRLGGIEVLREIRADPALRALPVVVMTTSNTNPDIRQAYEAGANSYVVKPANFDDLIAFVDTLIEYWFGVVELPHESA